MPSHQTLLNVPCHANGWLLDGVLRTELDWPLAYILSDTGDVAQLELFNTNASEKTSSLLVLHIVQFFVLPIHVSQDLVVMALKTAAELAVDSTVVGNIHAELTRGACVPRLCQRDDTCANEVVSIAAVVILCCFLPKFVVSRAQKRITTR